MVDAGYQCPAKQYPEQVQRATAEATPRRCASLMDQWETQRKHQSSRRIPVEHAIAELKWWRHLQRCTGRREVLPETIAAVATLVSDRMITW